MAYGKVNVVGVSKLEIEETQQNLENVKGLIGQTNNTDGTATTGTIMAKLNKLLTDWTTTRAGYLTNLNSRLTSTRATRLDNIGTTSDTGGSATAGTIMAKLNKLITDTSNSSSENIDTINDNIGTTTDTGGTSTAGTVMAKLNRLLTDWTTTRAGYISNIYTYTSNLNTRLTSTRAGYLDKLANIGATGDTGGSATAGTLMAKLNALLGSAGSGGLKIKSIQHGYAEKSAGNTKDRKITISTVNIDKAILLTFNENSSFATNGSVSLNALNRVPILYSTYLLQPSFGSYGTITNHYSGFSYYIIEFE